jgi:ABC-2 type transport system ATP-binding protein
VSNPPEVVIEVRDVRKQYAPKSPPAIDQVSFDIRRGEVFSLLGPNGAGKSTLISMLCGLVTPDSGDITLFGHPVRDASPALRSRIGLVPQELALYDFLSGAENLKFWGRMHGMSPEELNARVTEVGRITGLNDRLKDPVHKYSGGMKRRLNIAIALLHEPDVLIMDEPTVGVDPQSRRNILDAVKDLNKTHGLTVIYTSHYMEEVQELSDRVMVLDQGRLIGVGTVGDLIAQAKGRTTVELEIDDGDNDGIAIKQSLARQFANLPGSADAVASDAGVVSVQCDDPIELLPQMLGITEMLNCKVRTLQVRQPNLETVFFALTGKTLRD